MSSAPAPRYTDPLWRLIAASHGRVATVAFKVSYVGTDPSTVARVANRIALFYVEKNDEMRSGQVSRTVAFLKQELDSTKARLDRLEQNVIDFTTTNAGALPQQVASTLAKYGQATQQIQMNTGEQLRLMERRDALQNEIANLSTPGVGVDTTNPVLKLAQAQRELDELKLRFADNMPEVKDKRNEIAALQTAATAAKKTLTRFTIGQPVVVFADKVEKSAAQKRLDRRAASATR